MGRIKSVDLSRPWLSFFFVLSRITDLCRFLPLSRDLSYRNRRDLSYRNLENIMATPSSSSGDVQNATGSVSSVATSRDPVAYVTIEDVKRFRR
jgi:hypothetical protein